MLAECVANCVLSAAMGQTEKGRVHFLEWKHAILADTFERQ